MCLYSCFFCLVWFGLFGSVWFGFGWVWFGWVGLGWGWDLGLVGLGFRFGWFGLGVIWVGFGKICIANLAWVEEGSDGLELWF